MDYCERHFSEKISLDQIARNMYLSPFYISRLFKNEVGDTPINYLIRLRMKEAEQLLLAQPDASVQDIAKSVGYEDATISARFLRSILASLRLTSERAGKSIAHRHLIFLCLCVTLSMHYIYI